jgi:hypothetical protein
MSRKVKVIGWAVAFAIVTVVVDAAVAQNLIYAPAFQSTNFQSAHFYPRDKNGKSLPTTWVRHRVVLPSEVNLDGKDGATMKGARHFSTLHDLL